MLFPGTNNVASITGVNAASKPTVADVDNMLAQVNADNNTVIYVNLIGQNILNQIGKDANISMTPNDFGYSNQISSWNGVPIVVTDSILNTEVKALWEDSGA